MLAHLVHQVAADTHIEGVFFVELAHEAFVARILQIADKLIFNGALQELVDQRETLSLLHLADLDSVCEVDGLWGLIIPPPDLGFENFQIEWPTRFSQVVLEHIVVQLLEMRHIVRQSFLVF